MFSLPKSSSSETQTEKHRDHEAASWASTQEKESNSADSLYKASGKNRSPPSSQLQRKCVSAAQPPTVATRQARAEVGEVCWCHMFTLHSGHMGIVFETVTPFWLHLIPEPASTCLSPVYKISLWAVLTSKQQPQKGYQCKDGKWSVKQEIVILHLAVSPCRQVFQSWNDPAACV